MDNNSVRRKILRMLSQKLSSGPSKAVALEELARDLDIDLETVEKNVSYLSDPSKRFIQLEKVSMGRRTYTLAHITAAGIDLLEDPSEFNNRYPPQIIYQYIGGDNLAVSIGPYASEVTVGKDIVKLQFGGNHKLEEACELYIDSLESRSKPDVKAEVCQLIRELKTLLKDENVNLGDVQRIKQILLEKERWPAASTATLFSHPAIAEPIMKAVRNLIGTY